MPSCLKNMTPGFYDRSFGRLSSFVLHPPYPNPPSLAFSFQSSSPLPRHRVTWQSILQRTVYQGLHTSLVLAVHLSAGTLASITSFVVLTDAVSDTGVLSASVRH